MNDTKPMNHEGTKETRSPRRIGRNAIFLVTFVILCLFVVGLYGSDTMSGFISRLFGGKPELKAGQAIHEVDANEAERLIKEGGVVVLDVRTPKEWAEGLLSKDAVKLDFHGVDFEADLEELDREKPYLVHCAAGVRSAKTRDRMVKLGFKWIYHFGGGSRGWEAAGMPFVERVP